MPYPRANCLTLLKNSVSDYMRFFHLNTEKEYPVGNIGEARTSIADKAANIYAACEKTMTPSVGNSWFASWSGGSGSGNNAGAAPAPKKEDPCTGMQNTL